MSSEIDISTITIAALYWASIDSFNRLLDHFNESQRPLETLADDYGRLKVWAENVAAHRRGVMSLDHRLREDSEVSDRVKDLLKDLNDILEDTLMISSEDTEGEDSLQNAVKPQSSGPQAVDSMDSDTDDEIRSTSPLKEAVKEIGNVITCLYRLSITVQNPASANRLERMERIDVSHFESFDIDYVSNKFPLGDDYRYLIERLGKANTKRRQLLKYHNEHHVKIIGRKVAVGDALDTGSFEDQDDFYSEAPSDMRTTVSTVYPANSNLVEVMPVDLDSRSEAGFSATSYASSSADSGGLRVPAPPSGYDKGPFQCPYCFIIVQTENRASWKKHVFQDLRPYVCTFKDCAKSAHLYESRHEWFSHEREMHRREWFCSRCKATFPSSDQFRKHLGKKHKAIISGSADELDILIARGARAIEGKQKCPLCQEKHAPKALRSHLGRHLEQISLFILPGASEGNEDSDTNHHSDDDDIATAPDTKQKTSMLGQRVRQQYATARTYLKAGTGINDFDKDGLAPIHKAAKSGDLKWITLLLDSGSDPRADTKDEDKMQALHIAVGYGHEGVFRLLLARDDIDVNEKNGQERTALILACEWGRESVVKLLIARDDVDVNAKDNEGKTALMWACRKGNEGVVTSLCSRDDIDVNAKDNEGKTAMMWACRMGMVDSFGLASEFLREGVVKLLLALDDVDVNAKDNFGETAFMFACEEGYKGVVMLLLARDDIDVNEKNGQGRTALILACEWGGESVVKLLIARDDVDVNAKDKEGKTAFIWACERGLDGVAKLLLARGDIDVNAKNNEGKTALILACEWGHEGVVKLLLARDDIDVHAKDKEGKTAMMWACRIGIFDSFGMASGFRREGVVKLLLSRDDVDVDTKDNDGKTALMWACRQGNEDVVTLLCSRHDIDFNAKDKEGKTAFIWACERGRDGVAKLLLARDDIDVKAKDSAGKTGLMYANEEGYHAIKEFIAHAMNSRHDVS